MVNTRKVSSNTQEKPKSKQVRAVSSQKSVENKEVQKNRSGKV